jgi:2-oxoglutarate ferredoxin oxidoreductase subunit gamma
LTVAKQVLRSGIRVVRVPTAEIALKVGNKKFQNMVALGALYHLTGVVSQNALEQAIAAAIPPQTLGKNIEAFREGIGYVRE